MLELKNICKTYRPKNGPEVQALKSVSVKFAEKGLVFILGKSGCGKSTMLNCIGGLDRFDSGEIIIKGKSSNEFTGSDFDSYRNTFLGFIFQEYNILSEFNIEKNIALALELQGKKATHDEVKRILDMVDLGDMGKRKTTELSGGQKQRVAIARALIKDPEIIIADEPTGALDSATGIQVFDTLKKLAQDKLVIVVSHDREFAEIYGDRIIEMKDGVIISDETKRKVAPSTVSDDLTLIGKDLIHIRKGHKFSQSEKDIIIKFLESRDNETLISFGDKSNQKFKQIAKIDDENRTEEFTPTTDLDRGTKQYDKKQLKLIKSRLKWKDSFKMGASSLKTKPVRLFFTILLSFVAFAIFGIVDTVGSFNRPESVYSTIKEFKQDKVFLLKEYSSRYATLFWSNDDLKEVDEKFPNVELLKVVNSDIRFGSSYYLDSDSKKIELLGVDLEDETSHLAKKPFYSGMTHIKTSDLDKYDLELVAGRLPEANDEIAISKHVYDCFAWLNEDKIKSMNDLLTLYNEVRLGHREEFKIVGIIDDGSDLSEYTKMTTEELNSRENNDLLSMLETELAFGFSNMVYISSSYFNESLQEVYSVSYRLTKAGDVEQDVVGYSNSDFVTLDNDGKDMTEVDLAANSISHVKTSLMTNGVFAGLGENDIIISENDLYNLGSGQDLYDLIDSGLTLEYRLGDSEKSSVIFTFNIVGVSNYDSYVANKTLNEVVKPQCMGVDYVVAKLTGNEEVDKKFIEYCETANENNEKFVVQNSATAFLDQFGSMITDITDVVFWVGVGFAVFAALLLMNFISTSISYKKREIGILRALGARSGDVFGIFFNESMVIALINFILATVATFVVIEIITGTIIAKLGIDIILVTAGIRQIALILGVSVLTAFLASIIPVSGIAKKQPIDAINNR